MALPSSGPLSLSAIQGEFGGANPIGLNEYYAGGAYVPAGTTGTYGAVPSSGTISIQNFYGTSNVTIFISNQFISDFTGGSRAAISGYRLTSGGLAQSLVDTTFTTLETWCTPTGQAVNYEVFITIVSGGLTSGTTGSWVALSTTRTWTLEFSVPNSGQCVFTAQIRKVGTTTVLSTATITLESDATP